MNVIIHALTHIPPLRNFLLLSNFHGKESELLKRFAGLTKKLWNPRLFKSQVSPHEFLQEVGRASAGKFRLEGQGDPAEFLGWLINSLHKDLGGTKKGNSSVFFFLFRLPFTEILTWSIGIIFSTFQGKLRMETQQVVVRPEDDSSHRPQFDIDRGMNSST